MRAVANWVGQAPVRLLPQKAPTHPWWSKLTPDLAPCCLARPPPDPQLRTFSYPLCPLPFHLPADRPTPGADSDSDSDLSLEEERSLSIPSSESEDNGRTRGRFQRPLRRAAQSERLLAHPKDVDGNDLLSYWPALGECEAAPCALQAWGSERRLGLDSNKDAANNNQPELALTSGDETSLGRAQRQRKGMSLDPLASL